MTYNYADYYNEVHINTDADYADLDDGIGANQQFIPHTYNVHVQFFLDGVNEKEVIALVTKLIERGLANLTEAEYVAVTGTFIAAVNESPLDEDGVF